MQPYVYILASERNGTLYIGVTSDLVKRVWEHKSDFVEGFTKQHQVHTLVWYEMHGNMESAITREKQLNVARQLSCLVQRQLSCLVDAEFFTTVFA